MANDTKAARTELERGRWAMKGLGLKAYPVGKAGISVHDQAVCLCAPCTDARIFARQGVK